MKRKTFYLALTLLIVSVTQGCENNTNRTESSASVQNVTAPRAMAAIAISDSYGAQVSQDILNAGGNAVDAAVAAGFTLAVTFIDAGNIGGGGFMTIKMGDEIAFLDYREKAPLAAHKNMYLDT